MVQPCTTISPFSARDKGLFLRSFEAGFAAKVRAFSTCDLPALLSFLYLMCG